MGLQNKKIALLVEKTYQDLELMYPYYRLKEEGAEVHIIGPKKGEEYLGKYGYPAKAEIGIDEADPKNYDAVIIPGGFAPDFMRRTPKMIEFVRQIGQANKIVAAICHGGWMLISADLIRGKKVTSFSAIQDDMKNAGGLYEDSEVVQDGNIITSRCPDDLPAFCKTIIAALS